MNFEKIKPFSGTYKMYRPLHTDPYGKVIVCSMTIGSEASPFDCTIHHIIDDEFGVPKESRFEGKMIPNGHRQTALLHGAHSATDMYFIHFDQIERHSAMPQVDSLSGVMIASVGAHLASAWPLFLRRVEKDEEFTPHVINAAECGLLPKPIHDCLARGAVYWDKDHYPRPFGKLGAAPPFPGLG